MAPNISDTGSACEASARERVPAIRPRHITVMRSAHARTSTGIDIRKVVRSGLVPLINTAIAHHTAARMIGAGIATPPAQPFVDALVAFGAVHP